jgi:hypothetical protein
MANDVAWFIAYRGLTRGRIDVLNLTLFQRPLKKYLALKFQRMAIGMIGKFFLT